MEGVHVTAFNSYLWRRPTYNIDPIAACLAAVACNTLQAEEC